MKVPWQVSEPCAADLLGHADKRWRAVRLSLDLGSQRSSGMLPMLHCDFS